MRIYSLLISLLVCTSVKTDSIHERFEGLRKEAKTEVTTLSTKREQLAKECEQLEDKLGTAVLRNELLDLIASCAAESEVQDVVTIISCYNKRVNELREMYAHGWVRASKEYEKCMNQAIKEVKEEIEHLVREEMVQNVKADVDKILQE